MRQTLTPLDLMSLAVSGSRVDDIARHDGIRTSRPRRSWGPSYPAARRRRGNRAIAWQASLSSPVTATEGMWGDGC